MLECIRGDLDRVSFASVLQLVEMEGHDGPVEVANGLLNFIGGQLVKARFLDLDGPSAAVEALVRAKGPFVVRASTVEVTGSPVSVQHLILDSCRLVDDLRRYGVLVPEATREAPAGLEAVLAKADGRRSLASLIALSGVPVVRCLDLAIAAIDRRQVVTRKSDQVDDLELLDVRPTAIEKTTVVPPSVPQGSFDELVFQARKLVRDRRYDDAEAALVQAVALEPGSRIAQQNLKRIQDLKEAYAAE